MGLTLCVRPGDGGIIVTVSGEVDVGTEALLRQALLPIIRERGPRLMLDVSGVSFMDCAGLRALLATRRRAELRGGFMRLIATPAAVRRIIELTGTHEALAAEREPRTVPSNPSFTERTGCDAPTEPYGRTAGKQP
jgi:anti-anti-sigma factor